MTNNDTNRSMDYDNRGRRRVTEINRLALYAEAGPFPPELVHPAERHHHSRMTEAKAGVTYKALGKAYKSQA